MSSKELTTLNQAATGHGLFAGHLSMWRESLPLTCKLCWETEETLLGATFSLSLHLYSRKSARHSS